MGWTAWSSSPLMLRSRLCRNSWTLLSFRQRSVYGGVYGIFFVLGLKEDDRILEAFSPKFLQKYTPVAHLREWDYNVSDMRLELWHQTNWDENGSMGATTLVLNQNCPIEVMGMAWLIACSDSPPNRKPFVHRESGMFFLLAVKLGEASLQDFFSDEILHQFSNHFYQVFWCSLLDDFSKGWVENQDPFMNAKKKWETNIPRVLLLYFFFNSWLLEDPDKAPLILAELVGGSQWFEDAEVQRAGQERTRWRRGGYSIIVDGSFGC